MASNKETAKTVIDIDGVQAKQTLADLKFQAEELQAAIKKNRKSDPEGTAILEKYLKEVKLQLNAAEKAAFDMQGVLKNLNGTSLRDLTKAQSQLQAEIRQSSRATEEDRRALDAKAATLVKVKAEIKEVTAKMNESKGPITKFSETVNKYWSVIAVGVGIAIEAFSKVGEFLTDWDQDAQSEKKLQTALKGREEILPGLMENAAKLQDVMNVPHEVIESQEAFLAAQGRTEDQIKKTMRAAIQMAAVVPGMDLDTAVKQLDSSYSGVLRGLNRLDPAFKQLTKEQLENGAAVDLINEKYSGFAEKAAKEGLGPIKQMGLIFTDIKENLGGFLASVLLPIASGFSQIVKEIRSITKPSESMVDQFYEQAKSVTNLQTNISPLLDKYDKLKSKSELSKNEHIELNKIIGEVTTAIPSAASAFDEYGKAIAINTGRARQFIDAQVAMMSIMNKKAIDESKKRIDDIKDQLHDVTNTMIEIESTGTFIKFKGSLSQNDNGIKATQEDIEAAKNKYVSLVAEKQKLYAAIAGLSGEAYKDELKRREEAEKKAAEMAKKSNVGDNDDAADIAKTKRMNALNKELEAKKITQEKFNEESLKIDILYDEEKLKKHKITEAEITSITEDKIKKKKELDKLYYDRDLKDLEESDSNARNELIKQHNDETISDATFKALTLQAELDFLNKKKELQLKSGLNTVDVQKEIDKKILDAQTEAHALLKKAKEELTKAGFDNIKDAIDREIAIKEDAWTRELKLLQEQIITKEKLSRDLSDNEIKQNTLTQSIILEKTKTYNDQRALLDNAKALELYDIAELSAKTDESRWVAQEAKAKKLHEQKLKEAGTDKKKLLLADKKYADDSTRIKMESLDKEEKIGNAKLDILNKGFSVLVDIFGKETALGKAFYLAQQAAAIGQVIFSANIANMKAVEMSPATFGQPWVAINTASEVVSIASILAQTYGTLKGKREGGDSGSGIGIMDSEGYEIAGVVHPNEYVVPAWMRGMPHVVNFERINEGIRLNKGYTAGGVVSPAGGSSSIGSGSAGMGYDPETKAILISVSQAMAELKKQLSVPISANVSLLGKNGFLEKQAELARIEENANI